MQSMKKWFGRGDKGKAEAPSPTPATPAAAGNAADAADAADAAKETPEKTVTPMDKAAGSATPAQEPAAKQAAPTSGNEKPTASDSAPEAMTPRGGGNPKSTGKHKHPGDEESPKSTGKHKHPGDEESPKSTGKHKHPDDEESPTAPAAGTEAAKLEKEAAADDDADDGDIFKQVHSDVRAEDRVEAEEAEAAVAVAVAGPVEQQVHTPEKEGENEKEEENEKEKDEQGREADTPAPAPAPSSARAHTSHRSHTPRKGGDNDNATAADTHDADESVGGDAAAFKMPTAAEEDDPERVMQKDFETILGLHKTFKHKIIECGGAAAFLRVCRVIDEQSTPIETRQDDESVRERKLSGCLDLDQFIQVLEAIKLSMHDRELKAIFHNFRHVHEATLPYEQFMVTLGLARNPPELLDIAKGFITRLCEAEPSSLSDIQKYFAKMPEESALSDFRAVARTASARHNNISATSDLHSFDIAELNEFSNSLSALGVGLSEFEVRRLFCAMRTAQPIGDTAIIKALELPAGATDEDKAKVQQKLFNLLEVPLSADAGAENAEADGKDHNRKKDAKKKDKDKELPIVGLRAKDQLLNVFTAFFDVLKQTLLYPHPQSGLQSWAIVHDLLEMMAAFPAKGLHDDDLEKPSVVESSVGVSRVVLFQYIMSKTHLTLTLPGASEVINSVLSCTDGEIIRLFYLLNKSFEPEKPAKVHIGVGDMTERTEATAEESLAITLPGAADCICLQGLFKLVGMGTRECLLVSSLMCDIAKTELEAQTGPEDTELVRKDASSLSTMLGGQGSSFYFKIKAQLVKGAGEEPEDLWVEQTPPVKLTESTAADQVVNFVWNSGGEVLSELLYIDDSAYLDPRWRLSVELFEENVQPGLDVKEKIDVGADDATSAVKAADAALSYFHGGCRFGIVDIIKQFVPLYSSDPEVAETGEVLLEMPFQLTLTLKVEGDAEPVACVMHTQLVLKSAFGSSASGSVLSKFSNSEERRLHAHKSSLWVYQEAGKAPNSPYLLIDIIKALLVKEKSVEDILLGDDQAAAIVKPTRPRRAARQRIERDLKGKFELRGRPVITPIVARDKVVAAWRGWKERKQINKMRESAAVIQRVYRGHAVYAPYQLAVHHLKETQARERKHLERFRRIRAKERELTMLRRIPASDFLNYDKLRRDRSVKVIQRAWRRKAGISLRRSESYLAAKKPVQDPLNMEAVLSAEALASRQRILDHIQRSNPNKRKGAVEPKSLELKEEPGRLAILHRKVKEAAEKKALGKNVDGTAADMRLARANLNAAEGRDGIDRMARHVKSGKDNTRRHYQELAEARARLNALMEGYVLHKSELEHDQTHRLASLGATKELLAELGQLPSLDDARQRILAARQYEMQRHRTGPGADDEEKAEEHNLWYINVNVINNNNLTAAADRHVLTSATMKNKGRWDVVSAPHDMTGPPISVTELSTIDRQNNISLAKSRAHRQRMATAWANREDQASSLCWVSYAAQQGKYDKTDLLALAQAEGGPEKLASALGIVSGQELLERLAKEAANNRSRLTAVAEYCKAEDVKVDRLASEFASQSMALLAQNRAGEIRQQLSAKDKAERHNRAAQIQALVRGRKDRRLVDNLRSQQRVAQALAVLVAELQRPGLRPGGGGSHGLKAVPMDAALLHRIGNLQGLGAAKTLNTKAAIKGAAAYNVPKGRPADLFFEPDRGVAAQSSLGSPGGYSLSLTATPGKPVHGEKMVLPSPRSIGMPRTPVSKREAPMRSPDSRLSAVTGISVREPMDSFDDEHDAPGGQSLTSGMGYVSSPSESMSQSAVSLNLFASPVHRSARKDSKSNAPRTSDVGKIMDRVSENYSRNKLSNVEAIVMQAQQAKLVNFKLDAGVTLLWQITTACGNNALRIATWLQTHQINDADGGCVDVTSASLLLGELAHELGLLDSGNEGTFQLIQLVLLLRMLAECWEDNKVRIRDVFAIAEDAVFKRGEVLSAAQHKQLTQIRFDLVHMSALKGCDGPALLSSTAEKLNIAMRNKLAVQDVSQLLQRLSPTSVEGDTSISGIAADPNVSTVNSQYLAELVVSLAANGDVGSGAGGVCSLQQLQYLLCQLPAASSDMRTRARSWLRAVPTLQANLLDAFSSLSLTSDEFTQEQVREALTSKTNLPVCNADAQVLAHEIVAAGGVSVGGVSTFISSLIKS